MSFLNIPDLVNKTLDSFAPDWVGDVAATAVAVAMQDYPEVAQHALDLTEDVCEAAGWDEAAVVSKQLSNVMEHVTDIIDGDVAGGVTGLVEQAGELSDMAAGAGAAGAETSSARGRPSTTEGWRAELAKPGGLERFEQALLDNDPSALAALDDSGFTTLLQIQSGRRDRRISTLSNMLQNEHSALSAVIANLRV